MEILLEAFCLAAATLCLSKISVHCKPSYNAVMVIGSAAYTALVFFAEGVLF